MRLILLAAGHGYALDGMVKCLLRDPMSGLSFLESTLKAFSGHKPTIVVGYRAVEIIQKYPNLDYIYNPDWAVTNNSHSLGLALSDEPCYVCSSDMLFDHRLIDVMNFGPDNFLVTSENENRTLTAINCVLDGDQVIETYMGPLRSPNNPEALGIFKISDKRLLQTWKKNCLQHPNFFVGQTLPLTNELPPISAFKKDDQHFVYEVNTPIDYLSLLKNIRNI